MIPFPDVDSLLRPEVRCGMMTFPSSSTELAKVDFVFDAGYAYQRERLCAAAAAKLMSVATRELGAQEVAEFLDHRGVVVDSSTSLCTSTLTVYMHRRYAAEVVPLLRGMVSEPAFAERDFEVWVADKRQELATNGGRSSWVARNAWYEALFGAEHPLGCHAEPADADRLELPEVHDFFRKHYGAGPSQIVLSGKVDDGLLELFRQHFSIFATGGSPFSASPFDKGWGPKVGGEGHLPPCRVELPIEGAQQTTLRVGRVLPREGAAEDYADLVVLAAILGGYFGSRLMGNLREEKGYTYGIGAHVQPYRCDRVLFITADVAAGTVDDAEREVMGELQRLADEPVGVDELDMVRNVLAGDAMRALDGVFERSDRYTDILEAGGSDLFSNAFGRALQSATPGRLQALAARWLRPQDMTVCRAGVV